MFRGNRIWKKLNIFWWKTRSLIGVLYVQFNFQAWNKLSVSDFKIKIYSRLAKIDTAKIDTFYEISRNFEKINNTLFGLHKTRILGLRIP